MTSSTASNPRSGNGTPHAKVIPMSTQPLRLLQIADLFITANDRGAPGDYERLVKRLELIKNGGGLQGFDYLVVWMDQNLTTVGFFWNHNISDGANDAIWEVVRRNLRSWSAGGPVILVSSCVPSPMALEDYSPRPGAILHLLGRTPLPMLDGLRYHALNWEATTEPNPPRLCRANILTLDPAADPPAWPRVQTCEFRQEISA